MLFNLPAWFLGVILHALFRLKDEASGIGMGALLAPWVWYPIGRWIDQHSGNRRRSRAVGRFEQLRRTLLRALAWLYLACAILMLLPNYHHRTPDTDFMSCTLLIWCGGYLTASFWGDRRDRRLAAIKVLPAIFPGRLASHLYCR